MMSDYSARLAARLAAVEDAVKRHGDAPLCPVCLGGDGVLTASGGYCPTCRTAAVDGRAIELELRQALAWARSAEAWEAAGD